jgi:AcrR family transcriptional regulator
LPKIVDHEERREELIAAVWRVIARDGLDASTIRAIAKETDSSAGALSHYFKDKDDILTFALKLSHRRIRERQNRKLDGLKGVEALRELVLDNLPLDEERELETRLEVGYWARSLTRPEVRKVQGMEAAVLHKRMVALIIEAQRRGDMDGETAASTIAERLLALIDGLSLHALLYPERLSPQAQMTIIDQEFVKLGRRSTAAQALWPAKV